MYHVGTHLKHEKNFPEDKLVKKKIIIIVFCKGKKAWKVSVLHIGSVLPTCVPVFAHKVTSSLNFESCVFWTTVKVSTSCRANESNDRAFIWERGALGKDIQEELTQPSWEQFREKGEQRNGTLSCWYHWAAAENGRGKGDLCRLRWDVKYPGDRGVALNPPCSLHTLMDSWSSPTGSGWDLEIPLQQFNMKTLAAFLNRKIRKISLWNFRTGTVLLVQRHDPLSFACGRTELLGEPTQ